MMDYRDILRNELRRADDADSEDVYGLSEPSQKHHGDTEKISDVNYLINHVPTQDEIVDGLNRLLYDNPDQNVMLVPIRPFLQTCLHVTSRRLDELIAGNQWLETWIDHIKSLQEVKISERFSSGELEDNKLKWMLWLVLGESVDVSITRASASADASTILMAYGNDEQ